MPKPANLPALWRQSWRAALSGVLLLVLAACAGTGGGFIGQSSKERQQGANTHVQLAQEYLKRGRLDAARDGLKRALELDPYSPDAHTVSGVLHETIGDLVQADLHYRRAVELRASDGNMNNNYASFLCRQGRFEEAERFFQRAIVDPYYKTPEVALANAGVCAMSSGEFEKAESYLRRALDRRPDYVDALMPMAETLFRRGDFLRARAFLQRYESAQPESPEMLVLGAKIEDALGDRRAAEEYRQRLQSSFPRFQDSRGQPGSEG